MTKKDYEAIARAIKDTRYTENPGGDIYETALAQGINTACAELAGRLASIMQADNPKFDRARFLQACGF